MNSEKLIFYYNKIHSIDKKSMFIYVCLLLFIIYIFKQTNIKLNTIIGSIIAILIIFYMIGKKDDFKQKQELSIEKKYNDLAVKPSRKYEDIIGFLYGIREFYFYNPVEYSRLVQNINSFMILYENIQIGVKYCKQNYDVANQKMINALNHLQSIVINIDNNPILLKKLQESTNILNQILTKYLLIIIKTCNDDIEKNGYDITKSKIIYDEPAAHNDLIKKVKNINNQIPNYTPVNYHDLF